MAYKPEPIRQPIALLTINNGTVQKLPLSNFQTAINGTGFVKASGTTLSYDNNTYTIANTAITGATKTKITYDAKGLVTGGADATTTDIAEGTNLYYTDARVRATPLTGVSTATATAVTATDNLLTVSENFRARSMLLMEPVIYRQSIYYLDCQWRCHGLSQRRHLYFTFTNYYWFKRISFANSVNRFAEVQWFCVVFDNSSYLTSETSTLAAVTGRGNTTATGISLTQNGNIASSFALYMKRNSDVSPLGNLIQMQNAAATTDLFKVDVAGNTTANSFIKTGGTSSQFLKGDGSIDNTTYLTGNQTITLSGDISGSGSTAITTSIGANK